MLHHISFAVTDLERSAAFYDAALEALGVVRTWSADTAVGYGPPGSGDKFAIELGEAELAEPPPAFHVAFAAPDRDAVAAFHRASLAQGGRDNGGRGLRPGYGPD